MQKRTLADLAKRLYQLTTDQLTQFLTALAKGDLEAAAKVGGGLSRALLADLLPTGETGKLLDALEKKAIYLHVQQARLSLSGALAGAASALRGLMEAPASLQEAMDVLEEGDLREAPPGKEYKSEIEEKNDVVLIAAKQRLPQGNLMEQKRQAIRVLFDIAHEWEIHDFSKAYQDTERAAEEDAAVAHAAAEQGIDLRGHGAPERLLRSVR